MNPTCSDCCSESQNNDDPKSESSSEDIDVESETVTNLLLNDGFSTFNPLTINSSRTQSKAFPSSSGVSAQTFTTSPVALSPASFPPPILRSPSNSEGFPPPIKPQLEECTPLYLL